MNDQHQRRALSAIAAGLVMLLAGCANAAAAQPASPAAVTSAATSASTSAASSPRAAPAPAGAEPTPSADNGPGCAARAMARGKFDPACEEYQGYLDPGTAGGRAPTSGEIQQQNFCRSGQISTTEC